MRPILIYLLLATLVAGCVHTQDRDRETELPPGAPDASEILADLTRAERAVANFSSNGTIIMKLPNEPAIQRFTRSIVRYDAPDTFFLSATKAGHTVRIYAGGGTFLLEHQAEGLFYYGHDGDRFPDVSLEIAPSVVLREFFLSDRLRQLELNQLELLRFDATTGEAVLAVYPNARRRSVERRLYVVQQEGGWHVQRNELFDGAGKPSVETRYTDYASVDSVVLPQRIAASLPGDQGRLEFTAESNTQINRQNPASIEDIEAVRTELLGRGYREVRGLPAEGQPR